MIQFLSVDWVIWAHDEQLAEHGGSSGIRDRGALGSVVAMPRSSFGGDYLHPTIWDMAAAYAFHIAQNQPFDDPHERLHDALIAIAERRVDKAALAQVFRELANVKAD